MRELEPMRRVVANALMRLAMAMGAKRVTVTVANSNHPHAVADAVLTQKHLGATGRDSVRSLLNQPSGKLLRAHLLYMAGRVAINGASDGTASAAHTSGVSAGWISCADYIESLSRQEYPAANPEHEQEQRSEEEELLERLSP